VADRQPVSELNLFEAYTPFYRRKFREEILPYVLKNGSWRGESQLQFGDGKVIPVSQVVLVNRENGQDVQGFASIAHDISEFKRIEQELNDSREDYRTLAEAAHDYIFVMDSDGLMSYANRYACQALGLDPERVVGMSAVRFFPESFSTELLQMAGEVREIDSPVYMEGSFWQNERELWLGTWLVPVHDSFGKLISILGIARDISDQRKTDDALRRALENEKQINQMRSNFFSMTSHQFRTPLSTILLTVELLKKYGARFDDAKRWEQLNRIEEAGERLHALLENILVISRVESGQLRMVPKDFDVVELCKRIIQELLSNDREAHPLEFSTTDDLIMVHSDSEVIGRVVENLVSNALKYSPNGSPVSVKMSREDQVIILEVKDQGIGIPEADQKRLFQPFQRAGNTEGIQGTGIGLTIVKKSVELLNGHVYMRSKEGQGTTFVIRFPVNLEADRSLERLGVR
jgi:PAS domain S-box-containing protein